MSERIEFETLAGCGKRCYNYDKVEKYLKQNIYLLKAWAEEVGCHPDYDFNQLVNSARMWEFEKYQHGYAVGKEEQQSKINQLEKDKQEAVEMLIKWHSIVFAKPYNSNEIMECDHVQLIEKLTGKPLEELLK